MADCHPLKGKHILITRPRGQADSFIDKIEAAGGIAHAVPLIAFRPAYDKRESAILDQLNTYEWIILTSKNGVRFFFQRLEQLGIRRSRLTAKFAAIGTKTADALKQYGFQAQYVPQKFSADHFAKEIEAGCFRARKALIPKGNLARKKIAETLRQQGAAADEWIVYETIFPEEEKRRLIWLLQEKPIDVITFTSPSAVQHYAAAVEEAGIRPSALIACIGPVTKKAAIKHGLSVAICPEEYTIEALAAKINHYYREEEG
ncbi:uroporphyrinogen-III synthase [Bacillus xiapuensis]|uniref:uroporphyrinogen-III synthase n=1 Tax=Bacillus xiapuensis TaxID=2014075 RepID=UPI000C24C8E3|nr:uroporphyrinogen-III synthase [Bacillus xiapuensis]